MKKAFTLVEIMIVAVIIGLLAAMAIPAFQNIMNGDQKQRDRYALWCKVTHRSDLTFEEWKQARADGLLNNNSSRP